MINIHENKMKNYSDQRRSNVNTKKIYQAVGLTDDLNV